MPDYKKIRDELVELRERLKTDHMALAQQIIDNPDANLEEIYAPIMNDLSMAYARTQDSINYITECKIH